MGTTNRRKFIQTTALPCSLEYAKKLHSLITICPEYSSHLLTRDLQFHYNIIEQAQVVCSLEVKLSDGIFCRNGCESSPLSGNNPSRLLWRDWCAWIP